MLSSDSTQQSLMVKKQVAAPLSGHNNVAAEVTKAWPLILSAIGNVPFMT